MNGLTKTFLVLLRLAIGWHFLVEGYDKLHSHYLGVTDTNRPWTSEFYLRESTGPFADYFRAQAGDLDAEALERLTLPPAGEGQDPKAGPDRKRLPPALDQEWNAYADRLIAFFQLDADQTKKLREKLDASKDRTARWLSQGKKSVKRTYPSGATNKEETTEARVQDYRAKLDAVQELRKTKLPLFGHDVEKERYRAAKVDANRARSELLADLRAEFAAMKQALRDSLTKEQLAKEKELGTDPGEATPAPRPVDQIDALTRYGLTAVGVCLLLGLFTRLACLGGAGFLLMFYLSMPPFPWLPENLRAEGHYLFVNKNLIEMLALLALATVPSGRWVGLDGLIFACVRRLNPFRRRPGEPRPSLA